MSEGYLTAEARARVEIDRQLVACGWVVQDRKELNLYAGQGVAVREFIMAAGHGRADYLLFVDGKAVGAVEAKPSGTPLAGVEAQSAKYAAGLPNDLPALVSPLPFLYESTGDETMFTDGFDPEPRSRPVVTFHRPDTLARWLRHWIDDLDAGSLRARLRRLGPVPADGLRRIQVEAIGRIETSMLANRPRALAQMATGSGKTFMAANLAYRLVQTAGAERVLFLVDRANLGRQTLREFQQFATPGDGRKFSDLYNVQLLTSNRIDPAARVVITTVQRLYSMRWIINFPTKRHWKSNSRIEDIDAGLDDLARVIADLGIRSIAVPPLGCGLGGLRWSEVKPLIEAKLAGVDAEILVFGPEGSPAAAAIANASPRPAMSVGKAAPVRLVDRYAQSALGGAGLIEVQKLMYFLQTAGQPLGLNYVKGLYGPYADNLRHVLIKVEGHFLTGFGDGTGTVLDAEPIEVLPGAAEEADAVVAAHPELAERIDRVLQLSEGFESAYGMELLATVHWAATAEGCTDRACVVDTVHSWNQRKERLFTPSHINTAVDHLVGLGWLDGDTFAA